MRVLTSTHTPNCNPASWINTSSNTNVISISPTSTLHIALAFSSNLPSPAPYPPTQRAKHHPVLLSSGVISTSPPYRSSARKPELIPYQLTFSVPVALAARESRHAALIAHLNAEVREEGGSWEGGGREWRRRGTDIIDDLEQDHLVVLEGCLF